MPFDFPAAPAAGDEYTSGGITYVWSGTTWDIEGGGAMTDYVLKAGDVMLGALGFGTAAYNINNDGSHLAYTVPAGGNHKFYAEGAEQFKIINGGVDLLAGKRIGFPNPGGTPGTIIHTGAAWIKAFGPSNEGGFEFWTANGGYSDAIIFSTVIGPAGGGIHVRGAGIRNDGPLTQTGNMLAPTKWQSNSTLNSIRISDGGSTVQGSLIEWHNPDGSRKAYLGWGDSANIILSMESATRFQVNGGDLYCNNGIVAGKDWAYLAVDDPELSEFNGSSLAMIKHLFAEIKALKAEIAALKPTVGTVNVVNPRPGRR
jgi:hypothetical protein